MLYPNCLKLNITFLNQRNIQYVDLDNNNNNKIMQLILFGTDSLDWKRF